MTRELVEAAKAVIADRNHLGAMFEWEGNDVLTSPNALRWQAFVAAVRAALSAYDSAPAPSEDRVREAAEAAIIAWSGRESDPKGWPEDTRNVITALRPYVTPAPALPAGTVAVNVETLREGVAVLNRAYLGGINRGDDDVAKSHNALSKILPPPPRPEPSAGLVEEWKAAARAESDKAYDAKLAALRAAWEADPKGKQ